jgi:quercetin dioxygenase-like cupin family protein/hemerythrin-like domain-containing protein
MTEAGPIAILVAEHEAAYAMFNELDDALATAETGGGETAEHALHLARGMLAFLHGGLEVHIRKEEEPLFPRLKAALPADDRLVDEMIAEHDRIRMKREQFLAVLDELLRGDDHDEVRGRRAAFARAVATAEQAPDTLSLDGVRRSWRSLAQTMRVHFQNEEEVGFPLAQELLSAAELAAAGAEMLAIDAESPAEPVHVGGLEAELSALLASPAVAREGRSARTLLKAGPLRLVLIALGAGGTVQEHTAPGPITLQALRGAVRVRAGGQEFALAAGEVLAIPARLPHSLHADAPSGVLLTMTLAG